MSAVNETIGDDVSRVSFRRLLRTGAGAEVPELAGDLGRPVVEIAAAVEDMSGGAAFASTGRAGSPGRPA